MINIRTSTSQAQQPAINEVKHFFQKLPQGDWIESEKHYPKLALVAMDFLYIPASTTSVERIFSTAGYAYSGQCNRHADANLEREVMFSKNKKYIDV